MNNQNGILIRQIQKIYPGPEGGFQALRDVSLEIPAGEFTAVTGRSGSGKSTMLNLITGIDRPTSGMVTIGGTDLENMPESKLAAWRGRNVGIVFQFFQLLPTLSILENIMLPMDFCGIIPSSQRKKKALELLNRVGIAGHAGKLPSALSGGEQQRAAIARALANDPSVVVADEPTGNLDTETAEAVFKILRELAQSGKTVVMVTHSPDLAERADRIITLSDGKIIRDSRNSAAA